MLVILHELTMNGFDHTGTSWWGYWPFWSNCNGAAVISDDDSGFAAAGKHLLHWQEGHLCLLCKDIHHIITSCMDQQVDADFLP